MAKISDLLSANSVALSEVGIISKFAMLYTHLFKCDMEFAKALYQKHGRGCIYTRYMVYPYNERKRAQKANKLCVVVYENGDVAIERRDHKKQKIDMERVLHERYIAQRAIDRKREKMFKDASGEICRKHQGQGRDLSMVGQYNRYPVKFGKRVLPVSEREKLALLIIK